MKKKQAKKATVGEIYEYYCFVKDPKLKDTSIKSRNDIFRIHILPYFANKKISKIKVTDIESWHGKILRLHLSGTRTRVIHTYFSALFNFVELRFGISPNPCKIAGVIGKKTPIKEMKTWSVFEFKRVIKNVSDYEQAMAISTLFWTGLRKGELYGLQWIDFDSSAGVLDINKAYKRLKNGYELTTLKNENSYRIISLPEFLVKDLGKYKKYKKKQNINFKETDLVFTWSKRRLEDAMREGERLGRVKRIRVHDLRHSHATLCLDSSINIVAISKRLGHINVSTTVNMYGHMRDEHNKQLIDWLDNQYLLVE